MFDDKQLLDNLDKLYLTAVSKRIGELEIPEHEFMRILKLRDEPNKFNNYYRLSKSTYLLTHLIDIQRINSKFRIKFNYYAKYNSDLKYSKNFLTKQIKIRGKKIKPIERNKNKEIPLYAHNK